MTIRKIAYSIAALCALLAARPASAHFLWGEVTQDKLPVAKLSLADGPGEASEEGFVDRIQTARVWDGNGQELTLKTCGGVRSSELKNSTVFSSAQFYGVLDKTKEGRGVFRCMHYAKSAQSIDEANQNLKLPFELFARRDGTNHIIVTARRGAALYQNAELHLYEPGQEKWTTFTTDAKGEIRFEAKPGLYGIKAAWIDETPGEIEGKKYPFTRNYSTLTFRVAAIQ